MKQIFTKEDYGRTKRQFFIKALNTSLLFMAMIVSFGAFAQTPTTLVHCENSTVTLTTANPNNGWFVQWESSTSINGEYKAITEKIKGNPTYTFSAKETDNGLYYRARVVNGGGQGDAISKYYHLTVKPSIEPVADITSNPEKPIVGELVTFTASSTYAANGEAVAYSWEIDYGTGWNRIGGNTQNLTLNSTPNGVFNVRCTITANSTGCYTVYTLTPTTEPISPLPVEIIYFTAAKQGNNVLLEWATASEENNTGFEVQVSQDGFNFRKLDFVPTKNGNTVIKQLYTFKDTENGKYGTRYYRLKQIDMDGQFEYFTTKAVSFGEVSNYSLKAFPNPFESEVSLELNADESGKLNVQVLDAMGRSVMTQQFEVSKGRSLEKITLWQSLPKGIYFVRTEMNGQANNFKLLKK